MSGYTGIVAADVRLLELDQVDGSVAGALGLQRLAEVTHLPTGIASGQVEAVDVPAGGSLAPAPAAGDEILLHVIEGQVRVSWGPGLTRELRAKAGDTVLVPAGTSFRADNASPADNLQLIRVLSAA